FMSPPSWTRDGAAGDVERRAAVEGEVAAIGDDEAAAADAQRGAAPDLAVPREGELTPALDVDDAAAAGEVEAGDRVGDDAVDDDGRRRAVGVGGGVAGGAGGKAARPGPERAAGGGPVRAWRRGARGDAVRGVGSADDGDRGGADGRGDDSSQQERGDEHGR